MAKHLHCLNNVGERKFHCAVNYLTGQYDFSISLRPPLVCPRINFIRPRPPTSPPPPPRLPRLLLLSSCNQHFKIDTWSHWQIFVIHTSRSLPQILPEMWLWHNNSDAYMTLMIIIIIMKRLLALFTMHCEVFARVHPCWRMSLARTRRVIPASQILYYN